MTKEITTIEKAPTNDQGHIIEALKKHNYDYVWEQVKWVGFGIIKSIDDRYIIFFDVVKKFNPDINNNFIHWFRSRLIYINSEDFKGNHVATSKTSFKKYINEYVSPSGNGYGSRIVRARWNWR